MGTLPVPGPATVLSAAVLAAAITLAGCGTTPAGPTAASSTSARYAKALAYAECMRKNGEPDFPDPENNGSFPGVTDASGNELFKAMLACNKLNAAPAISQAQDQRAEAQMLKYSECVRAHGVTGYPDPKVNSLGMPGLPANPPEVDVNTEQYRAAVRACENV